MSTTPLLGITELEAALARIAELEQSAVPPTITQEKP